MRKWFFYSYDLFVTAAAPLVALIIRENFTIDWQKAELLLPYLAIGTAVAAICHLVTGTHKGIWRYATLSDFTRIMAAITVSTMITLTLYFVITRGEGIARSIPLIQWAIAVAMMTGARLLARSYFRRSGNPQSRRVAPKEHTLVVGLNHVAELYLRCVADLDQGRVAVEGILDEAAVVKGRLLHHHKVIGHPAELTRILDDMRVHGVEITRIVVTLPFEKLSQESRTALLDWEKSGKVTLDLFQERLEFGAQRDHSAQADETTNVSEVTFASHNPYTAGKRVLDIVGSLTLIVLLSPFIVLTALLVAIDRGFPIVFWQQRPGRFSRPFRLYKFRTMGPAHDRHGNPIADEDRQSSIGYFLRRTRLDELPQLYNILVGDMSFVGPRPLLPVDHPENGEIRFAVRPGITGWAQINGGKLVTPEEKLALDVWYIKRMALKEDLRIALKTLQVAIAGDRMNREAIRDAMNDVDKAKKELQILQPQFGKKQANMTDNIEQETKGYAAA